MDYKLRYQTHHDWRSIASEKFALDYIGINDVLYEEDDLILRYAPLGIKTPEVVARDPTNPQRIISVEVKRICGNTLPLENGHRRKLKNRNVIIWPWTQTVYQSLEKANKKIVHELGIHRHHVVFVVPRSLEKRVLNRLVSRIESTTENYMHRIQLPVRHVVIHVIQGDDTLFDRF